MQENMATLQDRIDEDTLARSRAVIAAAQSVVALTGAGISAESGIPTFRDPRTGLWSKFRPEEMANAAAFRRDPTLVWRWYAWRRERVKAAQPNAGHDALARLEARVARFTLVTQNVDGLHARGGSRNLIELHGNVLRNRCLEERRILEDDALLPGEPPRCRHCGGLVRPDVVWFGETLPEDALARAFASSRECDAFLRRRMKNATSISRARTSTPLMPARP